LETKTAPEAMVTGQLIPKENYKILFTKAAETAAEKL